MVQKNAASLPIKKLLEPVWEKIPFKHYSLTTEKRVPLLAASSAPDQLT